MTLQALSATAQVLQPFLPRSTPSGPSTNIYNINGDFTIIGNTNLTLEDYSLNFQNNYPMVYVDEDNDSETFNSSAATLVFSNENGADPACTQVLFAGLYWTGRSSEDMRFNVTKSGITKNLDKKQVSIKVPGQAEYTTVQAQNDQIWFPESYLEQDGLFVGYADVTDLVKSAGSGEYWLADLALQEGTGGSIGFFGGWGMVVVYENALMEARDVVVFDGFAYVESYLNQDNILDLQGFSAVESGPVKVKLGIMAAEGERGGTGDYFEIEEGVNSGEFVRLRHDINDTFNFFNSSIFTGGNPRKPELINNTGMDLAVFQVPNEDNSVIANGQTQTRFNYASVIDTYAIFNITFSINARQTKLEVIQQFTGENPQVDDVYQVMGKEPLEFRVEIRNKGQEAIDDARVEIPLPPSVEFEQVKEVWWNGSLPGGINYNPSLGPGGTLVWEIGEVPVSGDPDDLIGYMEYILIAPDNCSGPAGFQCATNFNLSGEVTGKNANTDVAFSSPVIQGFASDVDCVLSPLSDPIYFDVLVEEGACPDAGEPLAIQLCNVVDDAIDVSEILGYFPDGSRFYDTFPVQDDAVEYTAGNPFPKSGEARSFVAVLGDERSCFRPFTLVHETMEAMVSVTSDYGGLPVSCFGASDGAVSVQVEGGNPPYTYQWDDKADSTTPSLENLPRGTYTVLITDSQNCTASGSVTLEQPEQLEILPDTEASNLDLGCDPEKEAWVIFEIQGGTAPVSADLYLISGDGSEERVGSRDFEMGRNIRFGDLEAGSYLIRALDTNGCLKESSFEVGGVEALSYALDVTPVQSCQNPESASIAILPDGDPALLTYAWSNGATTPTLESIGPGSYSVVISNSSGCSREETFTIESPEPPEFTIASSTEVICGEPGLKTTFLVILEEEADAVDIQWTGGEVADDGFIMVNVIPGIYTVTVQDDKGCSSSQEVEVLPYVLDASFDYSGPGNGSASEFFIGDSIEFEAEFAGNVTTFLWDFGDGTQSEEASPSHQYRQKGTFTVSLDLVDGNGCTAQFTREVTILAFEIRMPDGFTPDAPDGSNAHYFPVFAKIDGLEFWVFNKWGEVIFYTNDEESLGWNGYYQGKVAPAGSYVYRLSYTAPDGGQETKSGSFLLVR
ncbi:PKD domain-containing protein [Cyclobacterium jeungdonense]|uniref:PKD domain-containing protein n=2 Tax=Cyclobacterium jeungdonense TaxID=708087 RepID=A0ABT8C4I6_9BACT|nr:PKD domain-containing protein [Cyclobacterium jeungdonense]MDN3687626.1 PKD domain-containing protein [Cyclobacterium jeungdonense]